jgi:hypothetical protein
MHAFRVDFPDARFRTCPITRIASVFADSAHPADARERVMHEFLVNFSNARFQKVLVRLRESFLGTRHAGSRASSFARITRVVFIFADSAHPTDARERVMHEFRVDFSDARFQKVLVRLRESFLGTRDASSRASRFARITRVVFIFADSVHLVGAHERVHARMTCGFFQCSFLNIPITRIFSRYPLCGQPAQALLVLRAVHSPSRIPCIRQDARNGSCT